MDLVLGEEQKLLRQAAKDFANARSPLSRARKLRASGEGYSREVWKEMAELGWLGLTIDEEHGGAGLGHRYLMVVLEELGAKLAPEPILSTALVAATALSLGGSSAAQKEHLPAIAKGERVIALAHHEANSRFSLTAIDTTANDSAGGTVTLSGEKVHVQDGGVADHFIVTARAADGIALYLVPGAAKGVIVARQSRIDGRSSAVVQLEGVVVPRSARLGADGRGLRLLERVIDAGTAGLCAEMLGSMSAAFAMTLDYLKTRVQFGVPIGSFQALQHRASRLFTEIELARSSVMYANGVLDGLDGGASSARAVSVAKAKCGPAFMLVANEAVQMFGGIGMTEEHDIGLFLKRARVCEMTFGDAAWHRDRFARLGGY
jgi:alkylation response protein AidB-like acyl-CoA dehydrogenase